jgi:hypothetical protein
MTFPSLYLTVLVISSLRGPSNIFAYRVVVITGVEELKRKVERVQWRLNQTTCHRLRSA